jgi:hypothetical protein
LPFTYPWQAKVRYQKGQANPLEILQLKLLETKKGKWFNQLHISLKINFPNLTFNQFKSFSVHIDNLYFFVFGKVLSQFGNIHIHATGIEVIIATPDFVQGIIAVHNIVFIDAKQVQQFRLFGGESLLIILVF